MRNDSVIKRDVEEELACDAGMDATSIDVAVEEGNVHLGGRAASFADKCSAERTVLRVVGVKSVLNEIRVSLRPEDKRTDEELAIACSYTLQHHGDVPPSVCARVNCGWVTLEGTVKTRSQRQAVETAVTYLVGVRGMFNHIVVCRRAVREHKELGRGSGYSPLPMELPPMACY